MKNNENTFPKTPSVKRSNLLKPTKHNRVAEGETVPMNDRLKPCYTLKAIADAAGVSLATVNRYRKAGVDVYDPLALAEWHALNQAKQPDPNRTPPDLAQTRREKLEAERDLKQSQAEKAKIELEILKGSIVEVAAVKEANLAIAAQLKSHLKRAATEMPPRLIGLSERDMVGVILSFNFDFLTTLKQSFEQNS